ncbi:hemerythrin domain-containing protein [Magnetospirillum moscoviense]|uniref:Hemerythrin-like domain-containing protein n=1 Tax=Magnetospirillum moscoviense TaxID=1437059 RepID=A0A178N0E1_9PROT|nr:hemerythrin domain-containing protein [Magnetospirillum moscoviense]OAN60914.1 hypothetical protein A6A05_06810 [Magnetospirillum moscoviense]
MPKTDTYRKHHDDLRAIAARLETHLDAAAIADNPAAVATVVRELFGKFSVHLAIEDNTLYPSCLAHADLKVRDTARRFQAEMGDLGQDFDTYKKAWPGPLAIARDPVGFVTASRDMLTRLKARVAREEAEFYALVDKAA